MNDFPQKHFANHDRFFETFGGISVNLVNLSQNLCFVLSQQYALYGILHVYQNMHGVSI